MNRRGDADHTGDFPEPRLRLALAWAALFWERLWPRLFPAVALAGAFAALALFDLLPELPGLLHGAVLAGFALCLVLSLYLGLRGVSLPDGNQARRRLEQDSNLRHRPLTGLRDVQALGSADAGSRALWRLHRERLRQAARHWRVRLPVPGLAARDPVGGRALLALTLVVAAVAGWGDWAGRFERALTPSFQSASAAPPPALDLIITPPAYTGAAPIFLRAGAATADASGRPDGPAAEPAVVEVPVNSAVLARVSGGEEIPALNLGGAPTPFAAVDELNFEL
ncbi:MAG TPA: DUF4175 family protein, partial [Alphaproteobacteria bacterium]|nr:DUF4175 family protein [Alphaproteobacteria bacterium]